MADIAADMDEANERMGAEIVRLRDRLAEVETWNANQAAAMERVAEKMNAERRRAEAAEARLAAVEALCRWGRANGNYLTVSQVRAAARGEGDRPAEPWPDEDAARFLAHERAQRAAAKCACHGRLLADCDSGEGDRPAVIAGKPSASFDDFTETPRGEDDRPAVPATHEFQLLTASWNPYLGVWVQHCQCGANATDPIHSGEGDQPVECCEPPKFGIHQPDCPVYADQPCCERRPCGGDLLHQDDCPVYLTLVAEAEDSGEADRG